MNPASDVARSARAALLPLLAVLAGSVALAPRARAADSRKSQDIIFAEMPARTVGDAPFTPIAHATSKLPVVFEVVDGPAVLDGKRIRLTGGAGIVIVRASQAGNSDFQPSTAERVFTVNPAPRAPAVVYDPAPASAGIGEPVTLEVRATGAPEPAYQWRKDGAEISGATGRMLVIPSAALSDAGSYDVVVTNASGRAVSNAARVTVGRRRQTISFQAPPGSVPAGQLVSLFASSTSGLPVTFSVVSGAAILTGTTVTSAGGVVVIEASQPGDSGYDPAMPVDQTLVFSAASLQH